MSLPTMQVPMSPSHADWCPGHIPRLSYRNSASIDPSQPSPQSPKEHAVGFLNTQIPASRFPPPTSPATKVTNSPSYIPSSRVARPQSSTDPALPRKKKSSLLGGLFVKEASSAALEQVAAQLIAQHGELSARAIPGVSSQKMPDFVPKVNSKWDGIPEAAKAKERQEKERSRAVKRTSIYSLTRAQSVDSSSRRKPMKGSHDRRSSNSTMNSFDSRGVAGDKYKAQEYKHSTSSPPDSYMANSSGEVLPQPRSQGPGSDRSQSLRSPSGSSLREISSFFPNSIPAPPPVPVRYLSSASKTSLSSKFSDPTKSELVVPTANPEPVTESIPEHTSSPIPTPLERSPITPSSGQPDSRSDSELLSTNPARRDVLLVSSGPNVLGPPVTSKNRPKSPAEAFLAGEARPFELPDDESQPSNDLPLRVWIDDNGTVAPTLLQPPRVQQDLEQRPDTSRARLGLRASMVIRTDTVPWSSHGPIRESTPSPIKSGPRTSIGSKLSIASGQKVLSPASPKVTLSKGIFGKSGNEK